MKSNYFIEVEPYGVFELRPFTISLRHKVSINYQKLVDGDDSYLSEVEKSNVWVLAYLRTVLVNAPVDIEDMEVYEADKLLNDLFASVQKKEAFFRGGAQEDTQDEGTGAGAEPGVLVQG